MAKVAIAYLDFAEQKYVKPDGSPKAELPNHRRDLTSHHSHLGELSLREAKQKCSTCPPTNT